MGYCYFVCHWKEGSVHVLNCKFFLVQRLNGNMSGDVWNFNIEMRAVKFFFSPARQELEGNSHHSDGNIRGTCTIICPPFGEFKPPLRHILPIHNVNINSKNLFVNFHWMSTFCVEKPYDRTHLTYGRTLDRCCHFKHVSLKQGWFYHSQTSTAHR
jgi:hypothetical protein